MKTSSTSVKKKRSTVLKLQNSTPHVSNTSKSQVSCRSCSSRCVKAGKERGGKQRYLCTSCGKKQVAEFTYNAYNPNTNDNIIALIKEGVGLLSTARLLKISPTTLISRIKKIAKEIKEPPLVKGKTYEVDEIRTFVKKKAN